MPIKRDDPPHIPDAGAQLNQKGLDRPSDSAGRPSRRPPAFQFYAKDWLSSPAVRSMSLAAVGAYINLLATAWDSDPVASLPNDENRLWRLAGAVDRAEWDEISAEVMSNFEPEGKRLVNRRLQEVFENMLRHSDAQRDRVSSVASGYGQSRPLEQSGWILRHSKV